MKQKTRRLVESAVMLAVATLLSLLSFRGVWALGGSVTLCSMLPLVFISHRYGTKWGLFTAFVCSILQLLMGMNSVYYASNFITAVGIILLDYTLAFTVIGLSAMFNGVISNRRLSIIAGIIVTFTLRWVCHFLSGWIIWEALWPNELGWAAPLWSLTYNGSFMLPEIVITAAAAFFLYKPLRRYWHGSDLR